VTPHPQAWRAGPGGLRLLVRVTPKASREGVEAAVATAQGPALTVRVRAAADRGEANRATEAVVARWLGVPRSSVTVAAGARSRLKSLAVAGDPARLAALIEAGLCRLG
jgi:uncharacterized protein YggU (UPF0235/DUF167 family)